ncbi:MAG TPA: YceI family protein [Elusimicrobiota bacterium]|nr:YceI family protein [Elusimicrobiota bacterium]
MRMKQLAVILFLAGFLGTARAADTYKIDPAHSSIGFSVKHLVISTVKGNFTDYAGTILFNEKDVTKSSVKVVIKSASINTGIAARDNHLRSPDFFATEKYPELTFESKRVEKRPEGYAAMGTLTMRGVSKEVVLPFTLSGPITDPWGKSRIAAESGLTVNRQDYGVSWSQKLDNGGLVVSDEVKIELAVEAVKE